MGSAHGLKRQQIRPTLHSAQGQEPQIWRYGGGFVSQWYVALLGVGGQQYSFSWQVVAFSQTEGYCTNCASVLEQSAAIPVQPA